MLHFRVFFIDIEPLKMKKQLNERNEDKKRKLMCKQEKLLKDNLWENLISNTVRFGFELFLYFSLK